MLTAAAILTLLPLLAQTPSFEVATIKPASGDPNISNYPRLRHGTLAAHNVTLQTLLSVAYGLDANRITGLGWIETDRFDLSGKAPDGVPDTEIQPLLQSLLKERFAVVTHRESKELPIFELVPGKGGIKLQSFDGTHIPEAPHNSGGAVSVGFGSTREIASMLSRQAGRPVVDKIDLPGPFSYVLSFTPASRLDKATDDSPPDLFTAIQQQLGLKLEPKKATLEIFVVDQASRTPTPN